MSRLDAVLTYCAKVMHRIDAVLTYCAKVRESENECKDANIAAKKGMKMIETRIYHVTQFLCAI